MKTMSWRGGREGQVSTQGVAWERDTTPTTDIFNAQPEFKVNRQVRDAVDVIKVLD